MMGLGHKGGFRPADSLGLGPNEEPGRPLARRRQRRDAGRPAGRELLPAAQHELLPEQAAQPAAVLVERRRKGRVTVKAERVGRPLSPPRAGRGLSSPAQRSPFQFHPAPDPVQDDRSDRPNGRRASCTPTSRSTRSRRAGANIINIHHANEINPYINYPFLPPARCRPTSTRRTPGLRVKIYYTVRELIEPRPRDRRPAEPGHARSSLPGPGGGYPWLQEHLGPRLHRRLVRPAAQGRRRHHQRRVAVVQLLSRGAQLARPKRRDRRPVPRRRGLRPREPPADAQDHGPRPARLPDRPALEQQSAHGFAGANQYMEFFPLHRSALVRRRVQLRRSARLLADGSLAAFPSG